MIVVDGRQCVGLVGVAADGGDVGAHPEGGGGALVGGYEDVGSLADAEGYDLGCVRFDWDEVVGDDGQVVSINAEALDTSRSSVDQPQSVRLASRELEPGNTSVVGTLGIVTCGLGGAVKIHLAVDEVVVRSRLWVATICQWFHDRLHDLEVRSVVPILEEDWPEINVILDLFVGAVDDQWPQKATRVLGRIMGVIPCGSI